jgi:hypothetical protein
LVARALKYSVVCFRLDGGRTPDVHFNTVLTWDISCLLVLPLYGSSGQVTFRDFKASCSWRKSKFHYCGSWCRETTTRGGCGQYNCGGDFLFRKGKAQRLLSDRKLAQTHNSDETFSETPLRYYRHAPEEEVRANTHSPVKHGLCSITWFESRKEVLEYCLGLLAQAQSSTMI